MENDWLTELFQILGWAWDQVRNGHWYFCLGWGRAED